MTSETAHDTWRISPPPGAKGRAIFTTSATNFEVHVDRCAKRWTGDCSVDKIIVVDEKLFESMTINASNEFSFRE